MMLCDGHEDAPRRANPLLPRVLLWSLYARVYDNLRYLIGYQRLLESVAQIAAVQPHHRVVEVGCGTGNVLMRLAQESPRCLLGLDSSEPMLRRARAKLAGQSVNAVVQEKDLVRGLASWVKKRWTASLQ